MRWRGRRRAADCYHRSKNGPAAAASAADGRLRVTNILSAVAPDFTSFNILRSIRWDSMFTRAVVGTADMIEQHKLLNEVSDLVDAGKIRTTAAESYGKINAANLGRTHKQIESHTTIGKIVLEGIQASRRPAASAAPPS